MCIHTLDKAAVPKMFQQAQLIRDYVFPLCVAERENDSYKFKSFLGSGFLIGKNSYALTAAHVVDGNRDNIFALFVENNQWICFPVTVAEMHPAEDVAIIYIEFKPLKSIFYLNNSFETQSCQYRQFAYPEDMLYELEDSGKANGRPDMIYLQGYIRRRTNHPLPGIRGVQFFELSQIGGKGCSGSPIFKMDSGSMWRVLGIYVAECVNDRGTSVSYAVREDAFRGWIPKILGHSILTEAGN